MTDKDDFDLKLDPNGNPTLLEEHEKIAQDIRNSLNSFVGQKSDDANVNKMKEILKNIFEKQFSDMSKIESHSPIKVRTRWQTMGWKGRLEWWFMKTFLKDKVEQMRENVNAYNSLVCQYNELSLRLDENGDFGPVSEDLPRMQEPNWCLLDSKQIYDINAQIKLCDPISSVKVV